MSDQATTLRLGPLDTGWLLLDSKKTPCHIGALFTFTMPEDAPGSYLDDLERRLRVQTDLAQPFNMKLRGGLSGRLRPTLVEIADVDLDYHVRRVALPAPGGERELAQLASELHSIPLDFSKPLWEFHLIEGFGEGRFAVYFKTHHSTMDGVSGVQTLMSMMTDDASPDRVRALWTVERGDYAPDADGEKTSRVAELFRMVTGVGRGLLGSFTDSTLVAPYSSPESALSGDFDHERIFVPAQVPMDTVLKAARATGSTHNDIVMWLCSTAIRRYLEDTDAIPSRSLTAAVPVNLRNKGDRSVGTNIGLVLAELGTDIADDADRLDAIKDSLTAAKTNIRSLPLEARLPLTALTAAGMALNATTRVDGFLPPMFSAVISNVPGPSEGGYFGGAKFDAMYPVSLVTRKGGLNISCVNVAGSVNFGIVGARDVLPDLQRLADHLEKAAIDLETL